MNLLFVTSNRLGDAVLSTGVLAALLDRYPEAAVTVVCGPVPAPLFENVPGVSRVLRMEKRKRAGHWLKAWRELVGTRFALVVDLRQSMLGYFLGCPRVKRSFTVREGQHAVDEAASILGLDPAPAPRLWVTEADRRAAERRIDPARPLLLLGPTANFPGKQWPIERFQETARRLTASGGVLEGARIAVLGAPSEREQVRPLLEDGSLAVLDLVGSVSLGEAGALMQRADLFVGNDSGLMHMAAAAGCPTLGIFGPSDPARYGPYGDRAAAVLPDRPWVAVWQDFFVHNKPADQIMLGVDVDRVVAAATDLLARSGSAQGVE
ncbi:MAG: glycosyltransferase family 9 protein [Alphaproteobacteria bacterium]|nr:glycosyltransferase family 9 protein [Alphaproteobacteria bacterium]